MLNSVQNSSYLSALDVFKNLSIDDLKNAVNDDSQFTAYVSADAFKVYLLSRARKFVKCHIFKYARFMSLWPRKCKGQMSYFGIFSNF